MAAVSLFWDTNMAAVTSCENTLVYFLNIKSSVLNFFFFLAFCAFYFVVHGRELNS